MLADHSPKQQTSQSPSLVHPPSSVLSPKTWIIYNSPTKVILIKTRSLRTQFRTNDFGVKASVLQQCSTVTCAKRWANFYQSQDQVSRLSQACAVGHQDLKGSRQEWTLSLLKRSILASCMELPFIRVLRAAVLEFAGGDSKSV